MAQLIDNRSVVETSNIIVPKNRSTKSKDNPNFGNTKNASTKISFDNKICSKSQSQNSQAEFLFTNTANTINSNNNTNTCNKSRLMLYLGDSNDVKKKTFQLPKNNTSTDRNNKGFSFFYPIANNTNNAKLKNSNLKEIKEDNSLNFENIINNIKNDVGQIVNNMEFDKEKEIERKYSESVQKENDISNAYIEQKD